MFANVPHSARLGFPPPPPPPPPLMSDKVLGRGHRTIHKTDFMLAHDKSVKDSETRREDRKRKKNVREQEADLELEDEADEFLKAVAKKSSKSSSKTSSAKSKSNMASSSRSKAAPKSSDKGNELSAQQERLREKLIGMLVIRDKIAREDLDSLSLPLLDKVWKMGGGANAESPAKAPAKTPAKKVLSRTSSIQLLGSPLDALNVAKGKSGGAVDDTPVASRRKRRNSSSDLDDLDDVVKRPRMNQDAAKDKPSSFKPFKTSRPSSLAPSRSTSRAPSIQSRYSGSMSSRPVSRAGSAALTVISVSSSARAGPSKYNTSAGGLPDVTEELIELSEDEDEVKVVPKGKKRAASEHVGKSKSNKPKCSDYSGIPRKLIDATFYRVCAHLGHHGMFPDDQREYDRLIRKSWIVAVKEMGVDTETYPMEDEHEACVKSRIDSFRGRVRIKIEPSIAKVYHLASKRGNKLVEHVNNLRAGEFHKKPGVEGRAGNYQHPFLLECIHQAFFVGRKPVGVLYPELFKPIPIPALAYVCGMIEFLISLYTKGEFEDARAEASVVGGFCKNHLPNIELFQQCRPTKCTKYRMTLYTEAMKLSGKGVQDSKATRTGPGVLTAEDFEDEDEDEEGSEEGGEGDSEADEKPRKATPPATSGSRAHKTLPSKRTNSSSEASGSSSESGSSSSDNGNGSKDGVKRKKAHAEGRAIGPTSSRAANATLDDLEDVGGVDADHDRDSQPQLMDEPAGAQMADSVDDGKGREDANGNEGSGEDGESGSSGTAPNEAGRGGKEAEPEVDSINARSSDTVEAPMVDGSSRDMPVVAAGKQSEKRKGKQKAIQEEEKVGGEEEEGNTEGVETKGRKAKEKAKALLETKPKTKKRKK